MDIIDKLNKLKKSQAEIINKFDDIINETEKSSNIVENEKLKKKIDKISKEFNDLEENFKKIKAQNQELKQSLNEQIIDEKMNILKISKEKLELYFGRDKLKHENNLLEFEYEIKNRLKKCIVQADYNLSEEKAKMKKDILELELKLSEKIRLHKEKIKKEEEELLKSIKMGIDALSSKDLDEETINKRIKQNKIEMKIGLSWLNKIGMVLIIIAIAITAYYNRENINNYVKAMLFYTTGLVSIGLGELFYRKQKEVFSTGLLGGGIAIFYSTTFFSYFVLKENGVSIIDINTAIILSVIISLAAVAISIRYDSKIIISIGLIGGYLPFISYIFAFGFNDHEFLFAMGYLFFLNLIVLIISFWKQWRLTNYLSFIFNIPALVYIITNYNNNIVNLFYAILTFLMYLLIIIAYPLIYKKSLKIPDLILLAANTFFSSLIIYLIFMELKWNDFYGALALGFCLIYTGLGYFTNKIMKTEKVSIIIFYLTALTFAVLMVPFQFGRNYFLLGWLIEGTLLTIYGYKKQLKPMELAGWGIFILCLATFYLFDFVVFFKKTVFFKLKYFLVTAGSVLIFIFYQFDLYKNKYSEFSMRGKFIKIFKYFTVITLYIFLIYMALHYYGKLLRWYEILEIISYKVYDFFAFIIFALITMGMGLLLKKLKFIYDRIINIISISLFIIGDILCFILIMSKSLLDYSFFYFYDNTIFQYIALLVLIIYNIMVILSLYDLIGMLLKNTKANYEFLPLWIGIILFVNITGFIYRQLKLDNISIYIGFIYIILALLFISYGFWKKFLYIRFLGLGVILIALVILFLRIFIFADTFGKIISFFGFGFILILISFIYQVVNKNMEKSIKTEKSK
ncbi:MAG: DUF2339 domain-containing protein [Spirochaetes bacterium]|nr:DUF2339 domain-containing protein [Spirochaetota bacterium]